MRAALWVNLISLSRIPIALLFVISFKPDRLFLYVSAILALAALLTDLVDGYFARKWAIASVQGRHVDSVSDKAFYIAVIISFHDNGLLGAIVTWALLVRDVALYAGRIIQVGKIERLDQTRFYTKTHGYFLYGVIILGFVSMLAKQYQSHIDLELLYWFIQAFAWVALFFGVASIVAYLKLE